MFHYIYLRSLPGEKNGAATKRAVWSFNLLILQFNDFSLTNVSIYHFY